MKSLVAFALVVLGACGTSEPGGTLGARPSAGGGGKADAVQDAADLDRLIELLRADGTLVMPQLGVDHAANVLDVQVTVHDAGEVKAVAHRLITEISDTYVIDPATGTLLDHYDDDIKTSMASGWNEEALLGELVATVEPGRRAVVSALLDGYVLHFRIYQTSSEITAEEIFVYRPTSLDRAIIIRLSYAHA